MTEKVIEDIQEQRKFEAQAAKEIKRHDEGSLQDIKLRINTLLQMYLPPDTKLCDMETMACVMFDMVTDSSRYIPKR